jgi:hypothetical protein
MNAYARLAIFLGIAVALLVFATQHALQRGTEMAKVLSEPTGSVRQTGTKVSRSGEVGGETFMQDIARLQTTPAGAPDLFAQLDALPAGPDAVALTQQLEQSITSDNVDQYVSALITSENIAVARGALAALARTADAATVGKVVAQFGTASEQGRGRILQFLEQVQNPAAYAGLVQTVRSDTSEKGSPILGSAMAGLANLGNQESVGYLLSQLPTQNEFFVLRALERLQNPEGRRILEGALQPGNKDGAGLDADRRRMLEQALGER